MTDEESNNNNCLYVKLDILQKMFTYSEIAEKDSNEIGGLMVIDEPTKGGLVVEDIILPEQEVGSASFKMIPKGDWLKELVKSGKMEKVKGWWHSHRHMGTFYSGTDDDTLEDKWNGESPLTSHYAVGLVVSLPSSVKAWISYYKPIAMKKAELPVKILYPKPDESIQKQCEAEVKERVKDMYSKWNKDTSIRPTAAKSGKVVWSDKDNGKRNFNLDGIDPSTGLTFRELQKMGLWDFEIDGTGEEEVVRSFKSMDNPKWDERTCLLQSYNPQGRIICFKFGKNFDCDDCDHFLSLRPPPPKPASPSESKPEEKIISKPSEIEKTETKEEKK